MRNKLLLVLDVDLDVQQHDISKDVMFWSDYKDTGIDKHYSILEQVEVNDIYIKKKYLSLIYGLGELKIAGKSIVEYLQLSPSFSFWWMGLLNEKSNIEKSPQIDNIIKLLVFEDWLRAKDFEKVVLRSPDIQLAKSMGFLLTDLEIQFEWVEHKKETSRKNSFRSFFKLLPCALQSIIWLLHYIFTRYKLIGIGVDKWKKSLATITFVSYFFNFECKDRSPECFNSKYWGKLPDTLSENNICSNWLHIYVPEVTSTISRPVKDIVYDFNNSSYQSHVILDSFLCFKVVVGTLKSWLLFLKKYGVLSNAIKNKSGYLWPLLEKDLKNSLIGTVAISNLINFFLFREAMNILPRQEKGFYLQENQGWEYAFIDAWFSTSHGNNLVGLPHASVRYWDMRYFFDSRTYLSTSRFKMPAPDFIGVNGEDAKKMYLEQGYPNKKIIELEALRYMDLNNITSYRDDDYCRYTLLILGDGIYENTKKQMDLLSDAQQYLDIKIRYLVKPHPACPINPENYPELDLEITKAPISTLTSCCSMAFTSSTTASALDVYCVGIKVITALDSKKLNLSPLRNKSDVLFVKSSINLANELNNIGSVIRSGNQGKNYFYLDPKLTRWMTQF